MVKAHLSARYLSRFLPQLKFFFLQSNHFPFHGFRHELCNRIIILPIWEFMIIITIIIIIITLASFSRDLWLVLFRWIITVIIIIHFFFLSFCSFDLNFLFLFLSIFRLLCFPFFLFFFSFSTSLSFLFSFTRALLAAFKWNQALNWTKFWRGQSMGEEVRECTRANTPSCH